MTCRKTRSLPSRLPKLPLRNLNFVYEAGWSKLLAEEMDSTLGGMYIGTIHGFCLKALRDFAPDEFYMFDVIDDAGRMALVEQGYYGVLGLQQFRVGCRGLRVLHMGSFAAKSSF